jgi:hypothetical protein
MSEVTSQEEHKENLVWQNACLLEVTAWSLPGALSFVFCCVSCFCQPEIH